MTRVRVVGQTKIKQAWNRRVAGYERAAKSGLEAWSLIVRNEAVGLVQKGPKSGRVYSRGSVRHQASAPGQAPATDTGKLAGSIGWNVDASTMVGDVFATAAYAVHLELGTSQMAPRPFMVPALENTQDQGLRILKASLSRVST